MKYLWPTLIVLDRLKINLMAIYSLLIIPYINFKININILSRFDGFPDRLKKLMLQDN